MSYVIAAPEMLAAAATDLASIGSAISAANTAAAGSTTSVLTAGADEVSTAVAALFGAHAQSYQLLSAKASAFHEQLVLTLNAGAGSYASAEAANVQQAVLDAINAPTQIVFSRRRRSRWQRRGGRERPWADRQRRRRRQPRAASRRPWHTRPQRLTPRHSCTPLPRCASVRGGITNHAGAHAECAERTAGAVDRTNLTG
ncbi:Triacylglycerol lipase [Mycobacterium simulans]|nr:Triacylglycerol lipase [Mycobacterium simulans]